MRHLRLGDVFAPRRVHLGELPLALKHELAHELVVSFARLALLIQRLVRELLLQRAVLGALFLHAHLLGGGETLGVRNALRQLLRARLHLRLKLGIAAALRLHQLRRLSHGVLLLGVGRRQNAVALGGRRLQRRAPPRALRLAHARRARLGVFGGGGPLRVDGFLSDPRRLLELPLLGGGELLQLVHLRLRQRLVAHARRLHHLAAERGFRLGDDA